jgi:hypothetical protein
VAHIVHQHLFSWDEIDHSSDLYRLQLALEYLPDEKIVLELERLRGNGRDTYPVRATWNALLAAVVLQHDTMESLLRELRRNAELRQVCGFNPFHGTAGVPTPWAMSRFLANVIQLKDLIEKMFDELVERLTEALPGFGKHAAFDGKAIPSYGAGRRNRETGQTSDPDADWGTKTYRGVSSDGSSWEKVKRWFGYQLHLIVDSTYEIPVAFEVMPASTSEITRLLPVVDRLKGRHPKIVERCETLSADKGLDSGPVNKELWQEHGIKPIIDTRALWRDEKDEQGYDPSHEITRPLSPNVANNVVYTERGEVRCVCPVSCEESKMAFWGFEAGRDSLKYRCPAAAYGWDCPGRAACEQTALGTSSEFGRTVRAPLDTDRRIFTPIPRDTPQWQRWYAARTSVERVNSRIDSGYGFDHHTIRGLAKMQARMGLALAVMLAMAIGFISNGKPELMRSLVGSTRAQRVA